MHGLGLAGITRDRVLGSLSGGEQARLPRAVPGAAAGAVRRPQMLTLPKPLPYEPPARLDLSMSELHLKRWER
jgi:hypothetical protein